MLSSETDNIVKRTKMERITSQQLNHLQAYMLEHPDFARHRLDFGNSADQTNMWLKLAGQLNAFGPPVRDAERWRKTWADVTYKLREKYRAKCSHRLSEQQQALVKVLMTDKATRGVARDVAGFDEAQSNSYKIETVEWLVDVDTMDLKEVELDISKAECDPLDESSLLLQQSSAENNVLNDTNNRRVRNSNRNQLTYLFRAVKRDTNDWIKLTQRLNMMGPPVRSMRNWKKIWSDKKSSTIKKRTLRHQSGAVPISTIDTADAPKADPTSTTHNRVSESDPSRQATLTSAKSTPVPVTTTTATTKTLKSRFEPHYTNHFEKSLLDLLSDLRDEKRKQNDLLRQQVKHQRDMVKIKMEKLKLYRESAERERKEHDRKWNNSGGLIEDCIGLSGGD